MGTSEIMLAVTYDPAKVYLPAEVSIKLDGVAADFYKTQNGWVAQSRQGKPLPSTAHIVRYLNKRFYDAETNTHIVGELTVMGESHFKTAAGIIRRQEEDSRIVLNVYDMYIVGKENETYETRLQRVRKFISECSYGNFTCDDNVSWSIIRRVPVCGIADTQTELELHLNSMDELLVTDAGQGLFEGFMVRCLRGPDSKYKVGKRSRNMMRYKPKPTLDLEIVGFEEAHANKTMKFLGDTFEKGDGLQAVGRIIALYKGEEIGVGPGCLTHEERRELWDRYCMADKQFSDTLIAEVEYMLDNSYDALRQPVFKRWRTDKTEASEYA